jgi:hypothetical protein
VAVAPLIGLSSKLRGRGLCIGQMDPRMEACMHLLALEHITVLGRSPPDIVSIASEAGFDAVAICLCPSPILGNLISPLVNDQSRPARRRNG